MHMLTKISLFIHTSVNQYPHHRLHSLLSVFIMEYYYSIFLCFALSLLTIKLLSKYSSNNKKETPPLALPPSPPSLPVLGHLHLLKKPLHRALSRLSSLHGPALLLRFGSRTVLVISSLSLAEECFTDNDVAFASRPQLPSARTLTYNYTTLSTAPYGPHWRNVRRIATVELLSSARLHALSDVRHSEVKSLTHDLFREWSEGDGVLGWKKVELRLRLFGLAFNVMMRMIAGKRCYGEDEEGSEEARRFREVVKEVTEMIGASNVSDFLPAVMRVVDFGGVRRRMRMVETKKEAMLQGLIDELRRKKKKMGKGSNNKAEETGENKKKKSMLEVLLDLQEEAPEYYSDEIIKAMIITLFFAGTDTSTETLEWAMTLLLNHPETLHKARTEIDARVDDDRLLQEHDVSNLPYLQAIVSETLRLFPAAPLLVPHESHQECAVGGFRVPRGTMLLVNAWAIHRDPAVWADPAEFRPERFADGGGGKTIPFGMGRRRCPGDGLATRLIGLVLGTMIQCFEWERTGEELVDVEETGGITLHKANPLQAMCRPRQIMLDVLSKLYNERRSYS